MSHSRHQANISSFAPEILIRCRRGASMEPRPEQFGTTTQAVRKAKVAWAVTVWAGALGGVVISWYFADDAAGGVLFALVGFLVGGLLLYFLVYEPLFWRSLKAEQDYFSAKGEYEERVRKERAERERRAEASKPRGSGSVGGMDGYGDPGGGDVGLDADPTADRQGVQCGARGGAASHA